MIHDSIEAAIPAAGLSNIFLLIQSEHRAGSDSIFLSYLRADETETPSLSRARAGGHRSSPSVQTPNRYDGMGAPPRTRTRTRVKTMLLFFHCLIRGIPLARRSIARATHAAWDTPESPYLRERGGSSLHAHTFTRTRAGSWPTRAASVSTSMYEEQQVRVSRSRRGAHPNQPERNTRQLPARRCLSASTPRILSASLLGEDRRWKHDKALAIG